MWEGGEEDPSSRSGTYKTPLHKQTRTLNQDDFEQGRRIKGRKRQKKKKKGSSGGDRGGGRGWEEEAKGQRGLLIDYRYSSQAV